MTVVCSCGAVKYEALEGGRFVLSATDTIAIATVFASATGGNPSVKVEHLECGLCRTVLIP